MHKIKVVIAEDHDVVRQGLKILIKSEPDFEVSGEAEDGRAAVTLATELQPDVVIMDLAMPQMNGLEATREIVRRLPNSKVLVLSSYGDDESVANLLEAGASGFITKHSASEDLLEAIRQVNQGKTYFSPLLRQRLNRRNAGPGGRTRTGKEITARERQVLQLIAGGLASKEIALELGVSAKTVEKHRQSLMDKLDIHEIAGLTRYAASKGLVSV